LATAGSTDYKVFTKSNFWISFCLCINLIPLIALSNCDSDSFCRCCLLEERERNGLGLNEDTSEILYFGVAHLRGLSFRRLTLIYPAILRNNVVACGITWRRRREKLLV
jgi:hypothetical protein